MNKVDLWNKALALLPHDRRVEDGAEETIEAIRCRDHYDDARRRILAAHEWGWAVQATPCCTGSLAFHRPGPTEYAWPRPDGVVRLVGLFGPDGRRVKAQSHGGFVFSDAPIASVRYIPDIEDLDEWPAWALDALAAELGQRIAPLITSNIAVERKLQAMAAERLAFAIRTDASEVRWNGTDGRTFARSRGGDACPRGW